MTTLRTSKKEQRVQFKATGPEIELWRESAYSENKSLSDWIRTRLNMREGIPPQVQFLSKILDAIERNNRLLERFIAGQGIEVDV